MVLINTFSDEMAVYVLLALGDAVDCFLVLSVELELQFLNHITFFAKLLNSLAFCYINDHDLFYAIRISTLILRKNGLAGLALHDNQQMSTVIYLLLGVVGCAMVQSKFPVPGRPANRLEQGKGPLRMQ